MGGTPVRILLARHGETIFNVQGRWQGQSDSELTERGVAQARSLARALADDPIAAIYSSALGRARNTAVLVAEPHALLVETDTRLSEIDTGLWTGKDRAQITAEFPEAIAAWTDKPSSMRIPEGESIREVQTRALAFFQERMPKHQGETVLVISHGAVGQTIIVDAMGGSVDDLWLKERFDNCQISRLEWTPEAGLKLIELADVRHLEDVGSLRGWRTTDLPDAARPA